MTIIYIPNSVITIDKSAFEYCDEATTLTIGSGVTTIGSRAFYNCSALTAITSYAVTPPTIQSSTFSTTTYSSATLTVPSPSVVTAYKAANYWKNFTTIKAANNYELNQKLVKFALSRGFTYDIIRQCIDGDVDEMVDDEE
jgi:hypothetical protein